MSELDVLRSSVLSVSRTGLQSVQTVRDAFTSGIVPLQTANSGSAAHFLQTFTSDEVGASLIRSTGRFGLHTSPGGSAVPPPSVELDSVEVIEDRNTGVLDQFSVGITVSISEQDALRADRIRIFRAELGRADVPKVSFAGLMESPEIGGKGRDVLMPSAMRAAEIGVGNTVTSFVGDDPNSSARSVISPDGRSLTQVYAPQNTNRAGIQTNGLLSLAGADRSVIENLSFYLNRRSALDLADPTRPPLTVGSQSGVNVLKGSGVSTAGAFVQVSNALQFKPISTLSTHSTPVRSVGGILEMQTVDPAVVHGIKYAYYAAAIGDNDELGPRSRVVEVTVTRTVPPKAPDVLYSIVAGVPRFTLRCSPGTSHVEIFRSGRASLVSNMLGGDQSLIVEGPSNRVEDYYHAGDLGLGPDGSTAFVDNEVIPGDRVTYRFYAVDAFGLKSQTPFSCSLKVPYHGDRVPLAVPSITSEQTSAGGTSVRVVVTVDDPRIVAFKFSRRDVSANERAVHQANQPELFDLGRFGPKRAGSRNGPTPLDLTDWPSVMMASAGTASFVDTSVRLDRTYQYAVYGIDVRGNQTLLVGARPLGVYTKPTIDAPTDLGAKVLVESNSPKGVLITWTPGTLDFSPNHLVDDQDVLSATAKRSVFQVERRQKNAPFWDAMPATTESYFLDPVSAGEAPPFRPPYATKGLEYEYRVIAMQSGGYVSPRTDAISVSVSPPPPSPDVVWARSTPVSVRPLNAVISWTMPSQFIDHWEVQRAVVNKVYAAKIQSMDSPLARSLPYSTISNVTPESSRASGLATDKARNLDPSVYVGNRFFVDGGIDPSNSYFYRVRSVGKLGDASDWSYAGLSISDYAHDRKFLGVLSDVAKVALTSDPRPVSTSVVQTTSPTRLLSSQVKL